MLEEFFQTIERHKDTAFFLAVLIVFLISIIKEK